MTIEWTFFLSELMQNPILLVVTLLNIGVIIVNGATDAPNAIATAVSTRAMKPRHAIIMAAVFNFLGLLLVSLVSTTHTNTTAIMGVGAAKNPKSVKWSIAIDMVKTWVLTFPGCGILGFACAKLFLMIL